MIFIHSVMLILLIIVSSLLGFLTSVSLCSLMRMVK